MTAFAAIGLDHGHIHGQVEELRAAGGRLAGYSTPSDDLAAAFEERHGAAERRDEEEVLADEDVVLVACAAIPSERAGVAERAMRAGKDVLLDKPGVITRDALDRLKDAHAETGRRVRVHYSELESNAASQTALRLVREGAIGRLVHYAGSGPHRLDQGTPRPDWFWERDRNGGILVDIASHQIAQFLAFAGAERGRIVAARVASAGARAGFQDLGEMFMETEGGVHGYGRVDWYTPRGLPTWGDGRIVLTGTDGVLELRKYVDPAGADGSAVGPHLILTNGEAPRRIPCEDTSGFSAAVLADARDGTETAMAQETAFHLMELGLAAQEMAEGSAA